jgi:hypothetical protein
VRSILRVPPWLLAFVIAGCSSPVTPSPVVSSSPAVGSDAPSVPVSSPGSGSPAPERTPTPGYEGWETVTPQAARISIDGEALVMELTGSRLWFNTERAVLFHTKITGDFVATATVRTAKASDPEAPPGSDGTIQLAGLMARAEVPVENYVFIVAGSIGASTGVETKTTTSSRSVWVQRAVPTEGDSDLYLCRRGQTFRLAWRPPGSTDPWTPMATFERPDLPATLQVGANIYTDALPDLVARFEDLSIAPLDDGESCA